MTYYLTAFYEPGHSETDRLRGPYILNQKPFISIGDALAYVERHLIAPVRRDDLKWDGSTNPLPWRADTYGPSICRLVMTDIQSRAARINYFWTVKIDGLDSIFIDNEEMTAAHNHKVQAAGNMLPEPITELR